MLLFGTLMVPVKAAASEVWISPSPFLLICELPTSADLKFWSGMLTVCAVSWKVMRTKATSTLNLVECFIVDCFVADYGIRPIPGHAIDNPERFTFQLHCTSFCRTNGKRCCCLK